MAIQRNVQQQNAIAKERMLRCAELFESEPGLPWLRSLLRQCGHDPENGVLVKLDGRSEQEGDCYSGVWVDRNHRFWKFMAVIAREDSSMAIESFEEATSEISVNAEGRGTGKSFGHMALEVLRKQREVPGPSSATPPGAGASRHGRRTSDA